MVPSSLNMPGQVPDAAANDDGTASQAGRTQTQTQAGDGHAPDTASGQDKEEKNDDDDDDGSEQSKVVTANYGQGGPRFWAVMASLALTSFLASLENSVVVTSGPAIVADLDMGEEYVWVANAFFVCWSVLVLPRSQFDINKIYIYS